MRAKGEMRDEASRTDIDVDVTMELDRWRNSIRTPLTIHHRQRGAVQLFKSYHSSLSLSL